jgi:hypothetical protein
MNRTVSEIVEEIEGLMQAWREAPAEVWHGLYEELAEAMAHDTEVIRNGKAAIRRKISLGDSIRPVD